MSNWIATNELRWTDRKEHRTFHPEDFDVVRILQQKWECYVKEDDYLRTLKIEWRDVPIAREE